MGWKSEKTKKKKRKIQKLCDYNNGHKNSKERKKSPIWNSKVWTKRVHFGFKEHHLMADLWF